MHVSLGYAIVFASTVLYASLGPLMKRANAKLPPFTVIAIAMIVLATGAIICSLVFEKGSRIAYGAYKQEIILLIIAGLLNLAAFWLGVLGYKYMPLWQQSMFTFFTPLLTGLFAFLILKEPIEAKMFLGLVLMSLGLYVSVR